MFDGLDGGEQFYAGYRVITFALVKRSAEVCKWVFELVSSEFWQYGADSFVWCIRIEGEWFGEVKVNQYRRCNQSLFKVIKCFLFIIVPDERPIVL